MTTLVPTRLSDLKWRIYMKLDGSNWTDVSRDVIESYGVQWDRGGKKGGPNDRVAESGMLTFHLNNSHANSTGLVGYYSPGSARGRQGFDFGTQVKLDIAYQGRWQTEWVGRISDLEIDHGVLGRRTTRVTAKDWMNEAALHKLKGLATEADVRGDEVVQAIVNAMPIAPPGGMNLDQGIDTYPLAFDDVRDGKTTAMTEFAKLARSGLDYIFLTRDGALRYQNRKTRNKDNRNRSVLRGTMQDMTVRRSRDDIVNRIEVTVHPRDVDNELSVLWRLNTQPFVAPGQTVEFRGDFVDPTNPSERIGAVDMVTPLVAGIDYSMATAPSSSGTPDTPATLRPTANGTYTAFSGAVAAVADVNDSTGMSPPSAFAYHTFQFDDIGSPPIAQNATVSNVRLVARIRHNSSNSHVNWFVRVRLGGVDLDVFGGSTGENAAAGPYQFSVPLPTAPGGAEWTVAAVNGSEFGGAFNWNSATPDLLDLWLEVVYASQVDDNDRTGAFTVVTTAGGNSAIFRVTNNGTEGAYINLLGIRGRPIRDNEPVTAIVEDEDSIEAFGEVVVNVDMPYQPDVNVGATACRYLLDQYAQAKDRPDAVSFVGNLSEEHMRAALDREIGDRVGLVEKVTGLSDFTADGEPYGFHIVGVSGELMPGPVLRRTWYLAPADSNAYWHVNVEGFGRLGTETRVGPM